MTSTAVQIVSGLRAAAAALHILSTLPALADTEALCPALLTVGHVTAEDLSQLLWRLCCLRQITAAPSDSIASAPAFDAARLLAQAEHRSHCATELQQASAVELAAALASTESSDSSRSISLARLHQLVLGCCQEACGQALRHAHTHGLHVAEQQQDVVVDAPTAARFTLLAAQMSKHSAASSWMDLAWAAMAVQEEGGVAHWALCCPAAEAVTHLAVGEALQALKLAHCGGQEASGLADLAAACGPLLVRSNKGCRALWCCV